MQYSKHSFRRKQQQTQQKRTYNQNYHLKRTYYGDKDVKILVNRCDICNEQLPETTNDIQTRMNIIDEIDDSYESEHDKSTYKDGPKLILCDYCKKEYLLPSYK